MFRRNLGRWLIVAAGGGCLVVLFFVVLPMISEPASPVKRDGIVAQVLGAGNQKAGDSDDQSDGADGVLARPSSSPVGMRNDGEEVPVVFPASEATAAPAESPVADTGLLQVLSADDVAAARAALEGREAEPFAPAEDAVAEGPGVTEAFPGAAPETGGPADPRGNEVMTVVLSETVVRAAGEVVAERETAEAELTVVPARNADITERVVAHQEPAKVEVLPVESVSANYTGVRSMVKVPGVRRVEFDLPVSLDSRAPRGVSHPSGGVVATEAEQVGNPGLPPRTVRAGVVAPGTLRGVMGYRLPLVSRQEVPDQIVSGVLIPAHTTFVILKAGSWELVDVTPEELELLRESAAARQAPATEAEPARKGWNPLRIFRKR